jgi:hypothetical protein
MLIQSVIIFMCLVDVVFVELYNSCLILDLIECNTFFFFTLRYKPNNPYKCPMMPAGLSRKQSHVYYVFTYALPSRSTTISNLIKRI